MTLPEWAAFVRGFGRFHGAEDDEAPTMDDFRAALARQELARAGLTS